MDPNDFMKSIYEEEGFKDKIMELKRKLDYQRTYSSFDVNAVNNDNDWDDVNMEVEDTVNRPRQPRATEIRAS